MLSETSRLKFIKDFSIPMPVVSGNYFDYFINLYDPLLKTREKFELLMNAIGQAGDEEKFYTQSSELRHRMIDYISGKPAYAALENDDLPDIKTQNHGVRQENIYNTNNVGQLMISVDMKTANFQSLRYYDESLTDGETDFDSFVQKFNQHPYFQKSKMLRQVIFGKLNTKKQQRISRFLLDGVLKNTIDAGIAIEHLRLLGSDEFMVMSSEDRHEDDLRKIETVVNNSKVVLRVHSFWLRKVHPDYDFMVKEWTGSSPSFKNTPSFFFPQVVKYYLGMEIEERDMVFIHEGRLASFKEPLFA